MRVMLVGNGEAHQLGAFFRMALAEMKCEWTFIDERDYASSRWVERLVYRTLDKRPLRYRAFNRELINRADHFRPHMVLITKGSFVSPGALAEIRRLTDAVLVNFATDDPFNRKTAGLSVAQAIPFYDVYICTKRAIMEDVRQAGCANVFFVPFAYEPTLHFRELPRTLQETEQYSSDVVFIGGADSDRYLFFEALLDHIPNLKLRLYGGYWNRNRRLKAYACGFALGRDYRLALAGTKVAPCLVRRTNRDGHVMRTFEIPACGAFMLLERTDEHSMFFQDGREVACFSTPEEFVEKLSYYLCHEKERIQMALCAHEKIVRGRNTYSDRLQQILTCAFGCRQPRVGVIA